MSALQQRKFFTLIELLSVIGIIAIVASILLGGMSYAGRRADQAKTLSLMTQLEMALDAFKQDRGYFPVTNDPDDLAVYFVIRSDDSSDCLFLQLSATAGTDNINQFLFVNSNTHSSTNSTNRPYLELGVVTTTATPYVDAFGNAFQYKCPGTNNASSYDLWSKGSDGVSDNDDDICNWKRN